jgi:hypothetical protein
LTNVGTFKNSIDTFKCRSGIEAMFKDCKSGGYNLERSHANNQYVSGLILLIVIAYSCAVIQGQKIKTVRAGKYVGRLTEYGRSIRRHSSFWIGLDGQYWVMVMDFCQDIITLINEIQAKQTTIFSEGVEGYVSDDTDVLTALSPREVII